MTTPGWPCRSPRTAGSPARSCLPASALPWPPTAPPASTLTDNGMVFTTRFSGGRGGRNGLETELRRLGITQKNGKPNHPQTQGKVERFQQTAQEMARAPSTPSPPRSPSSKALLDTFTTAYNHRTPAPVPAPAGPPPPPPTPPGPKLPPVTASADAHDRVRHDKISHDRQRHPAHRRPPAPHRHRPHLRRNLRPAAHPGPRDPRPQRRHRRTPARTDPRPHPRLPAHRPPTRPEKTNTANPMKVHGVLNVLRDHKVPREGFEPSTYRLRRSFQGTYQLLLAWPEPVCSVSDSASMSPVSARFWHGAGTGWAFIGHPVSNSSLTRSSRPG